MSSNSIANIDTTSQSCSISSASNPRSTNCEALNDQKAATSEQEVDQPSSGHRDPGNRSLQSDYPRVSGQVADGLSHTPISSEPFLWKDNPKHYVNRFRNVAGSDECVVFFHGFPADSGKNEDIAEYICATSKKDAFVPHFSGLGLSEGLFSFRNSILDSLQFLDQLANTYSKMHIIGHSWGGLVAINLLFRRNDLGKIILLAPLTRLTDSPEEITGTLTWFIDSRKSLRQNCDYELQALEKDFCSLQKDCSPIHFVESLAQRVSVNQVHVLQGSQDSVVNPADTVSWVEKMRGTATLKLSPDDHWFQDRAQLRSFVAQRLSE